MRSLAIAQLFVDLPEEVPHEDPWSLSFASRFARLNRGEPRIAYFYEYPDNSTFRYRVHNMIELVDAEWPEASASYFSLADRSELDKVADAADVIVICRARYGETLSRFVTRARRRGVPIIFDVDDLVFDTSYVHLIMNTLDQPREVEELWDHWFAYVGRIGATLQMCDRAITTNEFLADRIKDVADIDVAVVPNFMNEWQLSFSRRIAEAKVRSRFSRDDNLHIGYFSGSPTHAKDFGLTATALVKILRQYPQTRIRMVGYLEPAGPLLEFQDRIDREPFRDYVNLQLLIGSTEINIAPLQDNVFTNCKSELKYFEAAITGTATIASPTHAFRHAIRHRDNARLALAHQWESNLAETIEELELHPDAYASMADRAIQDAEAHHGWRHQLPALRKAIAA